MVDLVDNGGHEDGEVEGDEETYNAEIDYFLCAFWLVGLEI